MTKRYHYYRRPKTTQERRWGYAHYEYVRGGRKPSQLPTSYDDISVCEQKSWKKKRDTQYKVGGRGKEHIVYLPYVYQERFTRWSDTATERKLLAYFDDHDISYRKVDDIEVWDEEYFVYTYRICVGSRKINCYKSWLPEDHPARNTVWYTYTQYDWVDVPYEKPLVKTRRHAKYKGSFIHYWTNKKLDLTEFGIGV